MCKHNTTELEHKVIHLDDGKSMLEIKLICTECKGLFCFITNKMGVSFLAPTTGFDRTELRVPLIAPKASNN